MEGENRARGENPRWLGAHLPVARGGQEQGVRGLHREGAGDLGRVHDGQGKATYHGGAPLSVTDTAGTEQTKAPGDQPAHACPTVEHVVERGLPEKLGRPAAVELPQDTPADAPLQIPAARPGSRRHK